MAVGSFLLWWLVSFLRKILFWCPLVLLDTTDYFERYVKPYFATYFGWQIAMPPEIITGLMFLALLVSAGFAIKDAWKRKPRSLEFVV